MLPIAPSRLRLSGSGYISHNQTPLLPFCCHTVCCCRTLLLQTLDAKARSRNLEDCGTSSGHSGAPATDSHSDLFVSLLRLSAAIRHRFLLHRQAGVTFGRCPKNALCIMNRCHLNGWGVNPGVRAHNFTAGFQGAWGVGLLEKAGAPPRQRLCSNTCLSDPA